MPIPNRSLVDTKQSPQNVLNNSYDTDFDVLATELVGYDGSVLRRLAVDANGVIKLDTTALDSRYVNVTGDTMTGGLTITPATDTLTALVVNDKDSNNVLTVDTINNRLGLGTTSPASLLSLQSVAANESATLGTELLSASGWTSTNWTGDWATGWTHTTGNTSVLSNTLAAVVDNYYQITYTVTNRTAGTFDISFGGQSKTYISSTGAFGPKATTTGTLAITPTSTFNGTIVISIKQITANSIPTFALYDNTGVSNMEIRSSLNTLYNTFIGKDAGAKNTTGAQNTATGYQALYSNTTGYQNTANGLGALHFNTTGYANTANGYLALFSNTTGYQNTANGYIALYSNTTGYANTANGVQALYSNTTGYYNTANGYIALYNNTTGYNNTANGMLALYYNTTGYSNTANGYRALYYNTTGYNNTASGIYALYSNTTGYSNTANGVQALRSNTTGYSNTANGYYALYNLKPTSKAITAFADYGGTVPGTVKATSTGHGLVGTSTKQISGTVNYNGSYSITVIDANSFYFTATWAGTETGWWAIDTEGRYNTAEGVDAGRTLITGDSNTFLGYGAGYNALQLTSATNSMALGNGAYTTASNQVVIGNSSITQTLLNGGVTITGHSDVIQLIVKANATQTANLQEWQTSAAAVQASLDVSGNMVLVGDMKAATYHVGATAGIDKSVTVLDADGVTTHAMTFSKGILTACT